MAAAILNRPLAVEMSVYVVRAFLQLRDMSASNKELARRLDDLERKLASHDQAITGPTPESRVTGVLSRARQAHH